MNSQRRKRSADNNPFQNANASWTGNSNLEVYTTSIILSATPAEVKILIVNGNVTIKEAENETIEGEGRSKRSADDENQASGLRNDEKKLGELPLILVSANPASGQINKMQATASSTEAFIDAANVVSRMMLTSDDPDLYDTEKARGGQNNCKYEEELGGTVFCPEYSRQPNEHGTSYKKVYSTKNVKKRNSDETHDMNIVIESIVNNETGHIEKGFVDGEVTLEVFSADGQPTKQLTLEKSAEAEFEVQTNAFTEREIEELEKQVGEIEFKEVNKENETNGADNSTGPDENSRGRSTRTITSTITLMRLFSAPVDLKTFLYLQRDSLETYLYLAVAFFQAPIAERKFGADVASVIWKVLNLRSMVKNTLENTKTTVVGFVNSLDLRYVNRLRARVQTISKEVNNIKSSFINAVKEVREGFLSYKAKVEEVKNKVQAKFEHTINTAKQRIIDIKSQTEKLIIDFKSPLEPEIIKYKSRYDEAKGKVEQFSTQLNEIRSIFLGQESGFFNLIAEVMTQKEKLAHLFNENKVGVYEFIDDEKSSAQFTIQAMEASLNQTIYKILEDAKTEVTIYKAKWENKLFKYHYLLNNTLEQVIIIKNDIASLELEADVEEKWEELKNTTKLLDFYEELRKKIENDIDLVEKDVQAFITKTQNEAASLSKLEHSVHQKKVGQYKSFAEGIKSEVEQSLKNRMDVLETSIDNAVSEILKGNVSISEIKNEIFSKFRLDFMIDWQNLSSKFSGMKEDLVSHFEAIFEKLASFISEKKEETGALIERMSDHGKNTISNLSLSVDTEIEGFKQTTEVVLLEAQDIVESVKLKIIDLTDQINEINHSEYTLENDFMLQFLNEELDELMIKQSDYEKLISKIEKRISESGKDMRSQVEGFAMKINNDVHNLTERIQEKAESMIEIFKAAFKKQCRPFRTN